jgi:hypothetical protein
MAQFLLAVVPIATAGLHCGYNSPSHMFFGRDTSTRSQRSGSIAAAPKLWRPRGRVWSSRSQRSGSIAAALPQAGHTCSPRRLDRNGRAPLRRVPPLSFGSATATLRLPSFDFAPQHCLRRSVVPSFRRSADPSAAPLRRLEPELLENGHRAAPPTPRASERPASYEFCDTAFGGLPGWSAYVYTDPGLIVVFDRAQAAGSCGIWSRPCRSLRWPPRRRSPPRRGPGLCCARSRCPGQVIAPGSTAATSGWVSRARPGQHVYRARLLRPVPAAREGGRAGADVRRERCRGCLVHGFAVREVPAAWTAGCAVRVRRLRSLAARARRCPVRCWPGRLRRSKCMTPLRREGLS